MSQHRRWELLKTILDPEDRWWWTAMGLVILTQMARSDEGRYWATFYQRLCECRP